MDNLDFQRWRHHPVTQCFLLFLAHRAQALTQEAVDRWRSGKSMFEAETLEARGRVIELEELCAVELSGIQHFYGKQPVSKKPKAE